MKRVSFLMLALCASGVLSAQGAPKDTTKSAAKAPISDNSFLVEEAYNQEPGVVQHISGFSKTTGAAGWGYSLTQEWPVFSRTHQLSYSIPFNQAGDSSTGIGDIMVNYRWQAVFNESLGLAVSPRVSWSFATGDYKKGLGMGGDALQVNLPISKTLGESFVSHTNVGGTFFGKAPAAGNSSTSVRALNLGQSFIWLARSRFNVMLETVFARTQTTTDDISKVTDSGFIIPGIRWGYDFASGLQVVPGIGVPIGFGPSSGTRQVFLYLSLEHPFSAAGR